MWCVVGGIVVAVLDVIGADVTAIECEDRKHTVDEILLTVVIFMDEPLLLSLLLVVQFCLPSPLFCFRCEMERICSRGQGAAGKQNRDGKPRARGGDCCVCLTVPLMPGQRTRLGGHADGVGEE